MNLLLKKIALPLVAVSSMAFSSFAYADSCLYYGVDLGAGQVNKTHQTSQHAKDLSLAVGCKFASFASVEGRVSRDAFEWNNILGDAEFTRVALLGRLEYTADRVLAYANLGVGHANVSIKDQKTENKTGLQWGVGLELFGSEDTAIYLGYSSQDIAKDAKYDVLSVGFRYYFKDLF